MPFIQFDLERWQSTWENRVRYNISESGVHPLSIAELLELSGGSIEDFTALRMVYNQSDGTDQLRGSIADLYAGANADQVTVTVGSAEANFVLCWTLIEPGDRVVIQVPTYMQNWGLARNFGADVATFALLPARGWEPDPADIERAITPDTKLVIVTDPNNPTGHVLCEESRRAIIEKSRAAGAWLLVDEVYRGAELNGVTTPSFWGSYERVVVVNGLSKAYGLPGLRIGWIVGPPELKLAAMQRHDYTVIGPSPASDYLARQALSVRDGILARTRGILNENWPLLEKWLAGFEGLFDWIAPECGAICMVRYRSPISALELVERIRSQYGILLVPGEHFHLPQHLRLGYGNERSELEAVLSDLKDAMNKYLMD